MLDEILAVTVMKPSEKSPFVAAARLASRLGRGWLSYKRLISQLSPPKVWLKARRRSSRGALVNSVNLTDFLSYCNIKYTF